jgi:GNAT superfamily N-acetyltransferase
MANDTDIEITCDPKRLDRETAIRLLNQTHFASHRSREAILKSFDNSLCFSAFIGGRQIGFGRVISDFATTAYLCDMVVDSSLRGKGVGQKLLKFILEEPSLKSLKWVLRTRDAAALYAKFDFIEPAFPGRYMERTVDNKGWDNT